MYEYCKSLRKPNSVKSQSTVHTMINETVGFVSLLHEHVTSVTVSAFTHCIDPMVFLQLHPARMCTSL